MEDKSKVNQVMDIQPPKQPESVVQPDQAPLQPQPAAPGSEAPEVTQESSAPAQDTSQDATINDVQEAPVEEGVASEVQAPGDAPILAATAQTPHKNHAPVVAIVFALVISSVLAGLTVYSFMNSDQSKDSATPQTEVVETKKADAAKATDVDALNSTIDEDFKAIDEAADYNDTAVSDTTLGL